MKDLIADSSFYICFLDDIQCYEDLLKIMDHFKVHISPKVSEEISKSNHFSKIKFHKNINNFTLPNFDIGELIKPFFSKDQVVKGEHEVIVIAYFIYNLKKNLLLIIDEIGPRQFVEKNYPYLTKFMIGTVGMIGSCCSNYSLFTKERSRELLDKIENSVFRVNRETLNKIRSKINK